jgi:hypothetical protein
MLHAADIRSTIVGSSLGGLLAEPAKSWSTHFSGTIFDVFPYLLPNLVCTAVVAFSLTVGILFLEETHEDKKYERDRGREFGQWILSKVWRQQEYFSLDDKDESLDEMRSMLDSHGPRAYRSTDSSPTLCSSRTSIAEPPLYSLEKDAQEPPKVSAAFTRQVCLNIVGVGILAL